MNDYRVDFKKLDDNRPLGVSGLMRVKNDGEFVSASIDSCIGALDELVIVYDDSEDNTEDILNNKYFEYSDKIKIYHYEPHVIFNNLSDDEIDKLMEMPADSPHLFANYCNWTMSKLSYRYAIIIDADQIYFSSKLKYLCDLYRSEEKQEIFFSERISCTYFDILHRLFLYLSPYWCSVLSRLFTTTMAKKVQSYVYKKICNDKVVASFSGLNIFYNSTLQVPLGKFYDGIQPPINGSGDHIFFKPNSQIRYVPWAQKEYHRVVEKISGITSKVYFGGGFLWLHLNPMRSRVYENNKIKYIGHTMSSDLFLDRNFLDIYSKYNLKTDLKFYFYQSLLTDKQIIRENLEKILKIVKQNN